MSLTPRIYNNQFQNGNGSPNPIPAPVQVCMFELAGKKVLDLLVDSKQPLQALPLHLPWPITTPFTQTD